MSDRIHVSDIEFHGYHGVSEAERAVGVRFRADLTLELDLRAAGENDELEQTVDYAAAALLCRDIGQGPSVKLIETLAERMAAELLVRYPLLTAVEVRVTKLFPPATVFASSGVTLRRSR